MTFSKKITFLVGGLLGSLTGLLLANKSGRDLREKIANAKNNQKKFGVIFTEYLKIGETAIQEARKNKALKKIIAGGEEVLEQLIKQQGKKSDVVFKHAKTKIQEILQKIKKPLKEEVEQIKNNLRKNLLAQASKKGVRGKKANKNVVNKITKKSTAPKRLGAKKAKVLRKK